MTTSEVETEQKKQKKEVNISKVIKFSGKCNDCDATASSEKFWVRSSGRKVHSQEDFLGQKPVPSESQVITQSAETQVEMVCFQEGQRRADDKTTGMKRPVSRKLFVEHNVNLHLW